jgi:hypothetical protein
MKKSHPGWIRNGGKYKAAETLIALGTVFGRKVPSFPQEPFRLRGPGLLNIFYILYAPLYRA